MGTVEIVLAVLCLTPVLYVLFAFTVGKRWVAGYSRWSQCWLGQHRWSMPGGWCEKCGVCDKFFGGHERCGKVCRHFGD